MIFVRAHLPAPYGPGWVWGWRSLCGRYTAYHLPEQTGATT